MHKKKIDIILVTLSSPLLIGLYEDSKLFETIVSQERSSDYLPILFKNLLENYEISSITYSNGPGSFMAVKVAYIFLKSLSILNNIPLYAVDAFYFNNNSPIKAIGKKYFVKIQGKIETKKFDEAIEQKFTLPQTLKKEDFCDITEPIYGIGAV